MLMIFREICHTLPAAELNLTRRQMRADSKWKRRMKSGWQAEMWLAVEVHSKLSGGQIVAMVVPVAMQSQCFQCLLTSASVDAVQFPRLL